MQIEEVCMNNTMLREAIKNVENCSYMSMEQKEKFVKSGLDLYSYLMEKQQREHVFFKRSY